jgi:hypothetical protein
VNADSATGIAVPADLRLADEPMNREQALKVTDQINTHSVRLVQVVVEAKRGSAHLALGFDTWDEYCDRALKISRQHANNLLRYAGKIDEIAAWTGIDAELFDLPERAIRSVPVETMVSISDAAIGELEPGATDVEQAAAASKAIKEAAKAQQSASQAVTAAARRRCVEHLTADPTLSVQQLAKAAGAPVAMAQDVWDDLEPVRSAHDEAEALARQDAANDEIPAAQVPAPAAPAPQQVPPPAAGTSDGTPAPAATGVADEDRRTDGAGLASHAVEGGPEDATPPAPASPETELAAERERLARLAVPVRKFLEEDPAHIVAVMPAEDRTSWCELFDDMAQRAHEFETADAANRQLRSVQ